MNALKITYEKLNIYELGEANCEFKFLRNKLMSTKLDFSFRFPDSTNYFNFYDLLLNVFKSNEKYYRAMLWNLTLIPSGEVREHLKKYYRPPVSEVDTLPDDALKYFGSQYWIVYNYIGDTRRFDGKVLQIDSDMRFVDIWERPEGYSYNKGFSHYKGPLLNWSITIFNENDMGIFNIEEESDISYQSYKEELNSVNLNYKTGVYFLNVNLNGVIDSEFILDLGAADVLITPDIYSVLKRNGSIDDNDELGFSDYVIADGSQVKSRIVNLKTLRVGTRIVNDVRASVSNKINSPLLLGQSALRKLGNYKIDNQNKVLIFE